MVVNTEQSSFGRMKFTISRLKRAEGGEGLKMIRDTRMNYTFKNFGYEIQIRNGTITGQVIMGKRMFLMKRLTMADLKLSGKVPSVSERLMIVVMS
jgi:hypothetical protein